MQEIFLGTGLGPRSYAIISQGMISNFIRARPEEMRVHLEEAAGVSLYRERRKETESLLAQTRGNLERVRDHAGRQGGGGRETRGRGCACAKVEGAHRRAQCGRGSLVLDSVRGCEENARRVGRRHRRGEAAIEARKAEAGSRGGPLCLRSKRPHAKPRRWSLRPPRDCGRPNARSRRLRPRKGGSANAGPMRRESPPKPRRPRPQRKGCSPRRRRPARRSLLRGMRSRRRLRSRPKKRRRFRRRCTPPKMR